MQDGYMRFMTTSERSELRIPEAEDTQDGFIAAEATASLTATLRLTNPSIAEDDNYTWMQVPPPICPATVPGPERSCFKAV